MAGIAALTTDLMDRTRLAQALPGMVAAGDVDGCKGADVVLVDLARHAGRVGEIRRLAPEALVIGYGPHVDDALLAGALADGADAAIPRSRLFRDPESAIAAARAGIAGEPAGSS